VLAALVGSLRLSRDAARGEPATREPKAAG